LPFEGISFLIRVAFGYFALVFHRVVLFLLFASALFQQGYAGQLRGTVSDTGGKPIPSVSIQVVSSTYGVVTNLNGEYYLDLAPGPYEIRFQSLGFEPKVIKVSMGTQAVVRHVVLAKSVYQLAPVTIMADGLDPAYAIIKQAIAQKEKYVEAKVPFMCKVYKKSGLESHREVEKIDSLSFNVVKKEEVKRMEFVESISSLYFKPPGQYKEVVHAYLDHAKKRDLDFGNQANVGFSLSAPGTFDDYMPPATGSNKNLFTQSMAEADFNFYANLMSLPALYDKPFVSPISNSALLAYRYRLDASFMEDSLLVHRIEVMPRRSAGPYFSGYIYIVEDLWCIKAVEFQVDRNALMGYTSFKLIINYSPVGEHVWLPWREEYFYGSKGEGGILMGHAVAVFSDYLRDPEFPVRFFDNALTVTEDDAKGQGLDYWDKYRPVTLKPDESAYVRQQDSIRAYYSSDKYKREADSSFNETKWLDFLVTGVGYRNSIKGYQFSFSPLIAQPRPFSVGGYRHALNGGYKKTWPTTKKSVGIDGEVSYGFLNNDPRGKGELSLVVDPVKFVSYEIGGGSVFELINAYNSIAATFSRGNYVLKEHVVVGAKRELANGLFAAARMEWSDLKSLDDYNIEGWSNTLFGELNEPTPFERYTKLELEIKLTIRFKQQYHLRANQKVIVGSKYPQVRVQYKWGIPGILGSMVNHHFLELKVFDQMKLGAWGTLKYNAIAGSFLISQSLRIIDYKFFRGSDRFFYSNPLHSFQLLGTSLASNRPYFQTHIIHHFNGAIFDKLSLNRWANLNAVLGGGALLEFGNSFAHYEAFAGIERPFRIGNELFKLGVYYVVSDNNQSGARSSVKVGFDFYNSFTRSWNY
jgi:hypothetical protein